LAAHLDAVAKVEQVAARHQAVAAVVAGTGDDQHPVVRGGRVLCPHGLCDAQTCHGGTILIFQPKPRLGVVCVRERMLWEQGTEGSQSDQPHCRMSPILSNVDFAETSTSTGMHSFQWSADLKSWRFYAAGDALLLESTIAVPASSINWSTENPRGPINSSSTACASFWPLRDRRSCS